MTELAAPAPQAAVNNNPEDFFDWDGTPDVGTVPDGNYLLHVAKLDETESKESGKRMIAASFIIDEPANFAGMFVNEYFVLGSDEAPKAVVPGALGTRRLKALMMACAIPAANSIQALLANALGTSAKFAAVIVEKTETEGDYKGNRSNNITSFKKLGELVPGVKDGGASKAPMVSVAPVAPVVAPVAAPAFGAAPVPVAAPVPAPVAPPVAAPVATPAPTAAPAPATGEQPIPCALCAAANNPGVMVLPSQLQSHIQEFHAPKS